jgi:hypothetical protein
VRRAIPAVTAARIVEFSAPRPGQRWPGRGLKNAMHIYWKAWIKPALTKDQAEQFAADVRRMLARLREERLEMEKLARKINKAIG